MSHVRDMVQKVMKKKLNLFDDRRQIAETGGVWNNERVNQKKKTRTDEQVVWKNGVTSWQTVNKLLHRKSAHNASSYRVVSARH